MWRCPKAQVVGKWVWLEFNVPPVQEIRGNLKKLGFHWNGQRKCWQRPCGVPRERSQGDPRSYYHLYLHKQISGDGFRDLYAPAEERMKQLNVELPKLEAEVDFLKVNKLSADDVLHEAATLYDRWPKLPFEDRRKIVEALIEKITIGGEPNQQPVTRSRQGKLIKPNEEKRGRSCQRTNANKS